MSPVATVTSKLFLTPSGVLIDAHLDLTPSKVMASRRGRTGGEKKSDRREGENERREEARESRGEGAEERRENEEQERENARVETEGSQTNFRQFVNDLKTKQHRVVEMRIALVCSFAVVARVLFSNQLSDEHSSVIQSSLLFAGSKYFYGK